ncbi:hypothetical protein AAHA92_26103 [Salvia divinorum]|uniref:Uncharacterized protein n=1 Tax=Salvia divinorum TaxID=28513 RepID=A0ABD1GDF5_SALDI
MELDYDYFKEKLLCGDINSDVNGSVAESRRVRSLLEYTEDGYMWRWRLPNSKALSSGLKDLNLEFDVTSKIPPCSSRVNEVHLAPPPTYNYCRRNPLHLLSSWLPQEHVRISRHDRISIPE